MEKKPKPSKPLLGRLGDMLGYQKRKEQQKRLKRRYVVAQIIRSVIFIGAISLLFWLLDGLFSDTLNRFIEGFQKNHLRIYGGFFLSELLFSLVPPEVFILALPRTPVVYIGSLLILSLISYIMGILYYLVGRWIKDVPSFKRLLGQFLKREMRHLKRFGIFLILLAAFTPVTYCGICLLVGSIRYPFRLFVLYSLARIFRFIIYGYVLWSTVKVNM